MNQIVKSIVSIPINFFKKSPIFLFYFRKYNNKYKRKKQLIGSLKINIINYDEAGDVVFEVSKSKTEKMLLMKVINHITSGELIFTVPAIELKRYSNATIFPLSDFILLENGAIWHKSYSPQFTKMIPADKDLLENNNNILSIQNTEKVLTIKNGFSLCGVSSTIWAHFLIQFLPKIDCIEKLQIHISEEFTVILPPYTDTQIREIVSTLLRNIKGINVLELNEDECVRCENLYHLPNTSTLSDHVNYISPSDVIIPEFVLSYLKNKFVNNQLLFKTEVEKAIKPFRKLFIKRIGGRNLQEIQNVEVFFQHQGFDLISPHEYSLSEKRKIFSEAEIIVGPYSSGFMNLIFCQPGTKVLVFLNFQRIYELYLSTIANYFEINLVAITGVDDDPTNSHTAYSIPQTKIENAYNEIIK